MTISTTSNTVVAQGNGLTTSFDFTFPVPLAAELFVYLTNPGSAPALLSPSQYSVTGIGSAVGGAVTYPLVGSPIPSGSTLTIQRVVPYQQLTDLVNQSGYYPNVVENALDYLTMLVQQLAQGEQLTLQVPLAATLPNLTLPGVAGRAGQLVGFDASGNAITYPVTASVGAGSLTSEGPFVAGTGFTPGVTTTLPLSQAYGTVANVQVHFDGAYQGPDQYTLSGNQIIFTSPIPVGVQKVYIVGGTTLSANIPAFGSVGTLQLQDGAVTQSKLAAGAVTDSAIAASSSLYAHVYGFTGSKDQGAIGNGTTDDHAALLSANNVAAGAGYELVITPGTYLIGASITFTAPVRFMKGARFVIPTGVTVAFNGGMAGPLGQIFACTGTGAVTVNAAVTPKGHPEWWGAQVGNTAIDNAPFIVACIVACLVTELQSGTYYTNTTIKHQTSGRTVRGVMQSNPAGSPTASAIVIQNATATVYQIGPDAQPGSLAQTNNTLQYVTIGRSVAPSMTATPAGVLAQYTVWTILDQVYTYDHRYGFQIKGTGNTRMSFCNASRYTPGVGGSDQFYGFFVDCSANTGFAGSNASLYMEQCVCGSTISIVDSQGIIASGAYGYSDLFIDKFETSNLNVGIQFVGNGNSGAFDYQNEDVHVTSCTLDTCLVSGIQFTNTSLYGAHRVTGGYIAFAPSAASPAGISYNNSKASVFVSGVQILCGTNSSAKAVSIVNSRSIIHKGNVAYECSSASGVYSMNNSTNCLIEDQIRNFSMTNGNSAFLISNSCVRNVLRMNMEGKASAFSVGYFIDNTGGYNELACSGIDPGCLGSLTYKLDYNGTFITAAGAFGTNNLASGIMN